MSNAIDETAPRESPSAIDDAAPSEVERNTVVRNARTEAAARKKKRRVWPFVVAGIVAIIVIVALVAPKPSTSSSTLTVAATTRTVTLTAQGTGTVVDAQTISVGTDNKWTVTAIDGETVGNAGQSAAVTVSSVSVAVGSVVASGATLAVVTNPDDSTTTITSPAAGTVRSLSAVAGAQLSGSVATIGVVDLHVTVPISEYDIANVANDLPVSLTFEGLGVTESGVVKSSSPSAATSSGGGSSSSGSSSTVTRYDVATSISTVPANVRLGMNVQATIDIKTAKNVLALPLQALTETTSGKYTVQTLDKQGKKRTVKVTVGLVGDSYVQITSGLKSGTKVVTGKADSTSSTSTTTTTGPGF